MYIACPNCKTKFMVLPDQIGEFGRRVKCSKCNNVWHQKLDVSYAFEPITMTPIMQNMQMGRGVNLPALLPITLVSVCTAMERGI